MEKHDKNMAESHLPTTPLTLFNGVNINSILSIACDWHWQTDETLSFTMLSRGSLSKNSIISSDLVGKRLWEAENFVPAFNMSWSTVKKAMEDRSVFQNVVICYVSSFNDLFCFSLSGSPVFRDDGKFMGYIGISVNLSEKQQNSRNLLRLLRSDPLTGYANWRTLEETFDRTLINSRRNGKSVGFVVFSIPEITDVVRDYGFAVTLSVLQEVGRRINLHIRKADTVGRLDLTEFVLILQDIASNSDFHKIIEKITRSLEQPFTIEGQSKSMAFKSGHITAPEHAENIENATNVARLMIQSVPALTSIQT